MIIFVQTMDSRVNPVEVDRTDSVMMLKLKFAMQQNLTAGSLQIFFNGLMLQESQSLTSCRINEGSTVVAAIRASSVVHTSLEEAKNPSAPDNNTCIKCRSHLTTMEKINRD